jgi:hypothetical protein
MDKTKWVNTLRGHRSNAHNDSLFGDGLGEDERLYDGELEA